MTAAAGNGVAPDPGRDTGSDTGPDAGRSSAIEEVEEALRRLTDSVRATMRGAAKEIDPALSLFGLKILQQLKRCGPTHSGAVAEMLLVDKSAISRLSRHLEELGLIEVQPDPNDGRARLLALTPAAAQRVQAVQTGIMLDRDVLYSWCETDLRQFAGYLSRLYSPGDGGEAESDVSPARAPEPTGE